MKRLLFFLACCAPFFCSASEIGQITTRLDNGSLHFSLNDSPTLSFGLISKEKPLAKEKVHLNPHMTRTPLKSLLILYCI